MIRAVVAALTLALAPAAAQPVASAADTTPIRDGRFVASTSNGMVHIRDAQTGGQQSFPAHEVFGLRVSRLGRVTWIARGVDGFEVHRADAAGRDRVLDSGPRIEPRSLTVRRTKLRWRNGSRVRRADFHGMRGDRPPIEDRDLRLVPGTSPVYGPGEVVWRYGVEVERGLPIDRIQFAAAVDRILFDRRGWLGRSSRIALLRVDQPPYDFRVTLAKPATVDRLCLPLNTGGRVSCENRGRSVINWLRWSTGSPYWRNRGQYRRYLINHEVGHSLGHGHRFCGGRGQIAPVMQQGTGPTTPCRHAQWPKPFERAQSKTPDGDPIPPNPGGEPPAAP